MTSLSNRLRTLAGVPSALSLIVIVSALLGSIGPASTDRIVVAATINVVFVVGLYIFSGNSGIMSFGHLSFATVGGYTAGLLVMPTALKEQLIPDAPSVVRSLSLEPFSAVIAAGVAASLLALVVVVPLSRISGLAAGIATVSLLISVRVVASNWESVTRAQKSLTSIPISTTRDRALLWAVVAIFCAWIYQSTSFGRRLRASKSDEVAATSIGVNIPMQRGISFVLSAFFTGVGGALFALFLGSVGPNVFYLDTTFLIITMLVVGGVDSLTGAVAGVLSVSVLAEILRRAEGGDLIGLADIPARPGTQRVILGSLLVVILLRRSSGIVGANEISWPKRRRGRIGTGSPVTTPNAPMPVA